MNIPNAAHFVFRSTAVGGLAWVFVYPLLSGEKAEARRASASRAAGGAPDRRLSVAPASRSKDPLGVEEAHRQKEKKMALSTRLTQAGRPGSAEFMIISGVGLGCFATTF